MDEKTECFRSGLSGLKLFCECELGKLLCHVWNDDFPKSSTLIVNDNVDSDLIVQDLIVGVKYILNISN